jgi:nicotinamidase-related amidase
MTTSPLSALLLLDVMPVVVPAFGGDDQLLERLRGAATAARGENVPVIFVRVAFRDGHPEVSSANKVFSHVVTNLDFRESNPETTGVHPGLPPEPGDLTVVKRRVSAFSGSDLELLLRSMGVVRLVLAGVATSGVVLSTLRQAADLDFELTVLSDGCADGDAVVHDVLVERVFPAHADVVTTAEWVASLG